jgi:hypothetical protein
MGDEDPVATVTGLGLDAAATAAILGDTAARIFRL